WTDTLVPADVADATTPAASARAASSGGPTMTVGVSASGKSRPLRRRFAKATTRAPIVSIPMSDKTCSAAAVADQDVHTGVASRRLAVLGSRSPLPVPVLGHQPATLGRSHSRCSGRTARNAEPRGEHSHLKAGATTKSNRA